MEKQKGNKLEEELTGRDYRQLKELEGSCTISNECSLGVTEEESGGTGGVDLFCRTCGLSILGDNVYEITREFKQLRAVPNRYV